MTRMFLALSLTFSFAAHAHPDTKMYCKLAEANGDVWEATFTRSEGGGSVTSTAKLNDVDMPSVSGGACFSIRRGPNFRCPHGMMEIRFELYPQFERIREKGPMMRMIRWNGEQVEQMIEVLDCQIL